MGRAPVPGTGCGELRHQGNVLWARLAGSGASSSPSLPSQSATVLLPVEVIIFLTRSLLLLAFAVHLAERFLLGPGASCLFRYVPWVNSFWHHMSHFSTGQPLLVLYSTVSVLSSVTARHSNLASLPPLLCPRELFWKIPFPSSWPSYSVVDMLVWCPVHRVTFMAGDVIH